MSTRNLITRQALSTLAEWSATLNKVLSFVLSINIPQSIDRRLSEISYDEKSFNKGAPIYQKALNNSRYTHHLTFLPQTPSQPACSGRKN